MDSSMLFNNPELILSGHNTFVAQCGVCGLVSRFVCRVLFDCHLFPALLSLIEFVERRPNYRYGESDHQHPKHGAAAADHLAHEGGRHDVAVAHRGHGYDGPPVGVQHRHKNAVFNVVLKHVDEGGKHYGPHAQEENEKPKFFVV